MCVVDALDEHHGQGACAAPGHNVGRQLPVRSLLGHLTRPLDLILDGKVERSMMLKKRIPIILLYLLFIAGLSSDNYGRISCTCVSRVHIIINWFFPCTSIAADRLPLEIQSLVFY